MIKLILCAIILLTFSACNLEIINEQEPDLTKENETTATISTTKTEEPATFTTPETTMLVIPSMVEETTINETTESYLEIEESTETTIETTEATTIKETEFIPIQEPIYGEFYDDVDLITAALLSNDVSLLSNEKDIFVYTEVIRISNELGITNSSDFDKIKAVHDYIIENGTYDPDALDERAEVSPDSSTAYGMLSNGKGICLGYTKTFQIFMNYLGVECIIVKGSANDGEDHAWNMLKLDDVWYHIDVTWGDPVPDRGGVSYNYFLKNDNYMEITSHVWDLINSPRAEINY